ncbi:MAG: polysaccharide biosynthesis/export family protein [Gammaproteobacteria bacterium]|nr:polysaccharide biosynthesis/export family protein [Gammaproteobacteria bacterium]
MKAWARSGILFVAVTLTACAVAPGMKMTEPAEVPGGQVVRVTPITLDLLNQMEAARSFEVRQIAEEFVTNPTGYIIGVGDVLQIIVWDHPELTTPAGQFRDAETSGQQVGDDGYIFYPYVGMVKAAGMNVAALRNVLTERLSTYIQDPQLDVRVIGFRSKRVYMVGEINTPGVLPLNDVPLTIADAISLSGGLTPNAHKSGVNISRNGKVFEIDLKALYDHADSSQNLTLQHGDIVNVLDRSQQKVFVMGEVRVPKSVEIINGNLSLAAAIGEAGGVNQNSADSGAIYVVRNTGKDNPEIFHLDARYATGMLLAERFEMQAQDVIFVDSAGISQWNRVISQLLPTISIIGIGNNIGSN